MAPTEGSLRAVVRRARGADLDRARIALAAGTGVLVVGAPGSGRMSFVRELLSTLDAATRASIRVDRDIHRLEGESIGRIARATRARETVPVATTASHARVADEIADLVREGLMQRVELTPLSARELLVAAEIVLGAPLDAAAVPSFIPARGGEDLVALWDALTAARTSGALVESEGVWLLGSPVPPGRAVRSLLQSHTGTAPGEVDLAADVVDLIALTPEVTLTSVSAVVSALRPEKGDEVASVLEGLEERAVVEILDGADGPRLRLRDGLLELLLPQTLGVLRRRRLTSALVEVLTRVPPAELGSGELIAVARHAVALGSPLAAETLTRAATISLRAPDRVVSLELAAAAVERGGGFDAEMALAAAETQAGRSSRALQRLRRLVAEAEGHAQLSEALTALTNQVLVSAADEDSVREFEAAGGRVSASADPRAGARATALKGFMLFTLGDPIGAAALVLPALEEMSVDERAQAHLIIATAAFLTGGLEASRQSLDEAERLFTQLGTDTFAVQGIRTYVNVYSGRIPESLAEVSAFRDQASAYGQAPAEGQTSWAIGSLLLFSGRAGEALGELRRAAAIMERIGLTATLLLVRTDLAVALAFTGQVAESRRQLSLSLPEQLGVGFGLGGKALSAQGWIAACAGEPAEAVQHFIRAADAYSAPGHHLASLTELVNAARAGGATGVLSRIELFAGRVEGPYAALIIRYARALALDESLESGDGEEAATLAAEYDGIGRLAADSHLNLLAAEAFDHAATVHTRAGHTRPGAARAAQRSGRERDRQLAVCGADRLPMRADQTSPRLSERETELAALAIAGLSNQEIADRLVLSVRTVETHLQRVYQKLGIRGRKELSAVFDQV